MASDAPYRPKRFFQVASVVEADGGWGVVLDDRPLRTPAKVPLLASEAAAALIAAEWNAQGETIDPDTMPVTRLVNSAIDRVAPQREAVIDAIAAYGGSDLLCYRAESPAALIERQRAAWDPLLAWCETTFGVALAAFAGVMPAAQAPEALATLRRAVAERSDIGLAALHEVTTLSGSLVLSLAVDRDERSAEVAWTASRIDEDWQIEQWGRDAEADATAARRKRDFLAAARLLHASP